MSLPASVIDPRVGVSSPATIRSVVVLPQPEGPSSAKNEPRGTSRSRSLTAVNEPNDFVTLRSRSPSNVSSLDWACSARSAGDDIVELSFVLLGLRVGQGHEVERGGEVVVVGEDELVVDERRVDLLHLGLRALDRADVVDPGGELRGDLGLVV